MQKSSALAEHSQPTAAAGHRVLEVLDQLRRELAAGQTAHPGTTRLSSAGFPSYEDTSVADEQLVTEITAALAGLAESRLEGSKEVPASLRGALDGIDFVIRGEVLNQRLSRLPELLPSFVFLVLLPVAGKRMALRFAGRTGLLLSQPT